MREATGHEAAIWIGSSMGGYIAMAVAEREPTAVAGLVLIGTKSVADDAAGRAKRLEIATTVEHEQKHPNPALVAEGLIGTQGDGRAALVEAITANVARHSGAGVAWGQRAMAARPDRTAVLRNVDAPAVVIRGENDALSSLEDSQVMAEALGTEVVVLPGIGHLAAFEAPADVARALAPVFA
jgi:pimeloyl-ACP methyl ester carboxylesterase